MIELIDMKSASFVVSPVNIDERRALDLRPGDTVKVHQKIKEGEKTHTQIFEGLLIARKHGREAGGTFTVRKIAEGVGVERIFPLFSPMIEKIEILRHSKVRRAKLYYVRTKASKELRWKQVARKELAAKEKEVAATESNPIEGEK